MKTNKKSNVDNTITAIQKAGQISDKLKEVQKLLSQLVNLPNTDADYTTLSETAKLVAKAQKRMNTYHSEED
jgi:hypothetical protein